MLRCIKVAITGGVSSGKSSVCRILADLGAYVIDADTIVHHLLSPDSTIGREVLGLLGSEVVGDGQFDRVKIAEKVFGHPNLLYALERILHPAVREEVNKQYQQVYDQVSLFVVEVPLLYEAHWEGDFDAVVLVRADEAIAQKRYQTKSGKQLDDFTKRMDRQMSLEEKVKKADYVLINNGSPAELAIMTKQLYSTLTGKP